MRKCTNCNIEKSAENFYKDYRNHDNLQGRCKECYCLKQLEMRRTKLGLVYKIYKHQKAKSIKRGHALPNYSRDELVDWCFSKKEYHELYNNWVKSEFSPKLVPSIDRLDDGKGYSFSNIQIITWEENDKLNHWRERMGINNKRNISVLQYDLDGNFIEEYYSLKIAEIKTGVRNGNISNCCSGRYKTAGGFIWKYKKDA